MYLYYIEINRKSFITIKEIGLFHKFLTLIQIVWHFLFAYIVKMHATRKSYQQLILLRFFRQIFKLKSNFNWYVKTPF